MSSREIPLVSICIPTFNGGLYIEEALQSAVNQDCTNFEIIVSDDGSTDDTLSIIESFKDKVDVAIKIFHHEATGIGANWNHCVSKAEGTYIKFLFQDDVLAANCISEMVNLALTNASVGLVYCRRNFLFSKKTEKLKIFMDYYGNLHTYWDHIQVVGGVLSGKSYLKDKELLNSPKNKIGEPTAVLIKKECFAKAGRFNEQLKQTLDHEFWYRLMKYYDIGFIDKELVSFRLHDKQASNINKKHEIPDKLLLYKCYYRHLFWQLHPKNKFKLLKLYHPLFKWMTTVKRRFYD